MSDSKWQTDFEPIVFDILRSGEFSLKKEHHFGQPFVTAYQLAVAVEEANPELCQQHNMVIAEKTGDSKMNLAQYLARWLSEGIKNDPDYCIEGAWLSANGISPLSYKYDGVTETGLPNEDYGGKVYSLFRLKK